MKNINQLTREDLRLMPLHKLRHLDIQTREQEIMVQEVIDEKTIATGSIGAPLVFSNSVTDKIRTPEDEALLQAKIDAHNAANAALLKHKDEVIKVSEEDPADDSEDQEEEEIIEEAVSESKPSVFCQHCDSKGVRHKKNCTRNLITA